jgi:hypothetical protein
MSNLTVKQLTELAKSRLEEAEILFASQKYDAAVYLGGYAIELAIKAKICQVLKWPEFPPSLPGDCKKIFDKLYSKDFVKTHNVADLCDFLFCLSGTTTSEEIKNAGLRNEWAQFSSRNSGWSEENRYKPIDSLTESEARDKIEDIKKLLTFFL